MIKPELPPRPEEITPRPEHEKLGYMQKGVTDLLSKLEPFQVHIAGHSSFSPVDELKRLPRSGKLDRFHKAGFTLPVQSVHDHVQSLGLLGDIVKQFDFLTEPEVQTLIDCIGFHDLAETLITDIPDNTPLELHSHRKERLTETEAEANNLIAAELPEGLRSRFERATSILEDPEHRLSQLFLMLDKSEPILAVWRYAEQFPQEINEIGIEQFLEVLSDFFTNQRVAETASPSPHMQELVAFLQNPHNLYRYFTQKESFLAEEKIPPIARVFLRSYVQQLPMQFVPEAGATDQLPQ